MSTKGQIKMFETIGVLIVFFMLLSAGGIFYFKIQEASLQKDIAKARQLRLLQTGIKATYLPELDCSIVGVQKENCFDKLKLEAFPAMLENTKKKQVYFEMFGHSRIFVEQAYPPGKEFPLYDMKLEDFDVKIPARSPVLIYDPVADKYFFGVVVVETYAK